MDEVSADELRKGLAAGHEAAFAALYRLYGERLYRVAVSLLNRPEDAEDAVQEVFAAVVRSRSRLLYVESVSGYLFAALRNSAARIHKRRRQMGLPLSEQVTPEPAAAAQSPEAASEAKRRWLRGMLATLPAEQREILTLKIDGELTFAEIAATLGISPHTAASRYRYALEKLRAAASQAGGEL